MNRNKIISIAVGVVVVIFVVVVAVSRRSAPGGGVTPSVGGDADKTPSGPVTREAPPQNIAVPDKGAKNVSPNVAVPNVVSTGNSANTISYRSFNIKAEGGGFSPSTVIVKQGDTTEINITAVDRDYDFTQPDYGFRVPIPRGTTKKIQFAATAAGKFTFFCSICGGPSNGPVGYVVVAPK